MSDGEFGHVARTRRATITGVAKMNRGVALIRFRYEVGADLGGPPAGAAMVARGEWAAGYWPPAKGDVIRVVEAPTITLEARPR